MIAPTDEQQAAIASPSSKILNIAGPGSGKTFTLVERIKRLVAQGAQPENMAAVTYTNAAAGEFNRRLQPDNGSIRITIGFVGTLHSYCLRHLQRNGYADFAVLDQDEADAELERVARDCGVVMSLRKLRAAKGRWWRDEADFKERLVAGAYYRKLEGERLLDYDSILHMALASMLEDSIAQTAWEHLFVDEFQDCSALDMEIYSAITAANRFYVGDPRQAIFGFRGGDLAAFKRLNVDPEWEKLYLSRNFRSAPEIVEASNRLMGHETWR